MQDWMSLGVMRPRRARPHAAASLLRTHSPCPRQRSRQLLLLFRLPQPNRVVLPQFHGGDQLLDCELEGHPERQTALSRLDQQLWPVWGVGEGGAVIGDTSVRRPATVATGEQGARGVEYLGGGLQQVSGSAFGIECGGGRQMGSV